RHSDPGRIRRDNCADHARSENGHGRGFDRARRARHCEGIGIASRASGERGTLVLRGKTTMAESAPIISIRQISKRFPGVVALADVSIDIAPGEFHAICGENGAGKSTLMKILSGVYTEYEGELVVQGERAAFRGTRDAEAAGISIIHQELN